MISQHHTPLYPATSILVANLSPTTTPLDLLQCFSCFSPNNAFICINHQFQSRQFGFVTFDDIKTMQQVLNTESVARTPWVIDAASVQTECYSPNDSLLTSNIQRITVPKIANMNEFELNGDIDNYSSPSTLHSKMNKASSMLTLPEFGDYDDGTRIVGIGSGGHSKRFGEHSDVPRADTKQNNYDYKSDGNRTSIPCSSMQSNDNYVSFGLFKDETVESQTQCSQHRVDSEHDGITFIEDDFEIIEDYTFFIEEWQRLEMFME